MSDVLFDSVPGAVALVGARLPMWTPDVEVVEPESLVDDDGEFLVDDDGETIA